MDDVLKRPEVVWGSTNNNGIAQVESEENNNNYIAIEEITISDRQYPLDVKNAKLSKLEGICTYSRRAFSCYKAQFRLSKRA